MAFQLSSVRFPRTDQRLCLRHRTGQCEIQTEFNVPSAEICAQSLSALVEGLKPDKEREVRKAQFKEWMRQEAAFRKSLERAGELYAAIHA